MHKPQTKESASTSRSVGVVGDGGSATSAGTPKARKAACWLKQEGGAGSTKLPAAASKIVFETPNNRIRK